MLSFYEKELTRINEMVLSTSTKDIPYLFRNIPLGLFGLLEYGAWRSEFANLDKYLPTMASEKVQSSWTGTHGIELLKQSVDFVKCVVHFYELFTLENIENAITLDFGCGWGRLTRLLLKYIPESNIYAVDPWDESLRLCKEHNVRATLGQTQYLCREIPFINITYDLLFSFSVFTHLSQRAGNQALKTLRKSANPNSILAITVRSKEYWTYHNDNIGNIPLDELLKSHETEGFAFLPHNREPIEGDITYGDTTLTLEYIEKEWIDWQVVGVDFSLLDTQQQVVFLKPR